MTEDKTPRQVLIDYIHVKIDEQDWHGVSDAANDLRELDAREKLMDDLCGDRQIG